MKTSIYSDLKPFDWDPYRQPALKTKFFFEDHRKTLEGLTLDPFYAIDTIRKLMEMNPTLTSVLLYGTLDDPDEHTCRARWSITRDEVKVFEDVKTDTLIFMGAGIWK